MFISLGLFTKAVQGTKLALKHIHLVPKFFKCSCSIVTFKVYHFIVVINRMHKQSVVCPASLRLQEAHLSGNVATDTKKKTESDHAVIHV